MNLYNLIKAQVKPVIKTLRKMFPEYTWKYNRGLCYWECEAGMVWWTASVDEFDNPINPSLHFYKYDGSIPVRII